MIDLNPNYLGTVERILAEQVPDCQVRAFGSRVTWTAKDYSDLDLAIVGPRALDADRLRLLKEAFEESDLPFRVDVIDWHAISPAFRKVIEKKYEVVQKGKQKSLGMAGEWRTADIEEVAERVAMGPFGSSIKVETFVPSGVPVISGQHLHGFKVDNRVGFNFITPDHAKRLKNANVQRGDIIFTHAGNIGQVAYIPEDSKYERYVISQRQFYMRCNRSKVIPEFVVAYFKTPEGQHKLLANTSQVGVPSIAQPVTYLRTIDIPLPPLPEQRAIAHILGTLDDKIELNRRMSDTLEAMARALFKSWFVDFDPVRAKAEGRDPGLPPHIADLFPDRFVDSDLGEIPEGWDVKALSDLCTTQYGYTASAVDEPVGPKFLRVTDINKHNWIEWGDVPHCLINPDRRASYALRLGDLVVARMADPGKSAIVDEEIDAVFASYLVRLRTPSLAHSYYVYGFLKSDLYAEYAEGAKSGSVQANMNARVIVGARLVVPPTTLMEQFLKAVLPIRRHLVASLIESRTLGALRDTLLPKLISGQLRVKDAERPIRSLV